MTYFQRDRVRENMNKIFYDAEKDNDSNTILDTSEEEVEAMRKAKRYVNSSGLRLSEAEKIELSRRIGDFHFTDRSLKSWNKIVTEYIIKNAFDKDDKA